MKLFACQEVSKGGTTQLRMNISNTDLLLQYILSVSAEEDDFRDRKLGPIHLIKYAYIADLAYYSVEGTTFTGASWKFHLFGPWAVEVYHRIDPALSAINAERIAFSSRFSQEDCVRWSITERNIIDDLGRSVPISIKGIIRKAVHEYANDTPSLLQYVYLTEPMLRAAPGELLDFSLIIKSVEHKEIISEKIESKSLSKTARKKQRNKILDLKERIKKKLTNEAIENKKTVRYTPPRYDEVFWDGQEWLDSLAGQKVDSRTGEVRFSKDLWKSKARFDPDVS